MVHKPPQPLTAWPTSSAANFSKLPQDGRVKMVNERDKTFVSSKKELKCVSHGVVNPFYRERSPSSYRFQSFW
uniref:Uncharacterized protein n=1 Tax=Hyaloperonospora arabidopsidis (strain Emoy2) TaxID=559515 RepID=M4BYZ5_HYAAE